LIIFSDGQPTDGNPIPYANTLKEMNVIIVCCYLTDKDIPDPRRFYSEEQKEWDDPAKLMFNMSSEINNNTKVLKILARLKNWKLTTSGVSRLFIQANNPDVIEELLAQVNEIISSNDALFDSLGFIDLTDYFES
jgi:hypothetical protein